MPQVSQRPWAKLDRDNQSRVVAALPLVDHCLDVGAALEAVLAGGAWIPALTAAAGRALTTLDLVRMVALAALHDVGKANWGFQRRWDTGAERIGHEPQVAALIRHDRLKATPAGQALLGIARDWGALAFLPALFAHHGRPREEFGPNPETGGRNETWTKHVNLWSPKDGYDPVAAATAVIDAVRARWSAAWGPGAPLPQTARFVGLFAGLVTLADWIGSDAARFPVAGPHGAERDRLRGIEAVDAVERRGLATLPTPPARFDQAFGFPPRGVQAEAAADDLGPVALIEAETGAGKTEAALWRWLELRRRGEVDGLFFALPTRSAAVQLHGRVEAMLRRVWGEHAPHAVLAVPGYLRVGDVEGERLPGREVRWEGDAGDPGDDSRWAAERANQYLAARVAVGTIDQALLGALRVRHAPVRAATLARSLLVVDEVHASDAYMGALLERLLANHRGAGGRAVLLSATLGAAARGRYLDQPVPPLAEAEIVPYPALAGTATPPRQAASDGARAKAVGIEIAPLIDDATAIAARAVAAARDGASVLVVRNTVGDAVAVAQAVEATAPELAFRVGDVATLHHGRFDPADRRLLDAAVEDAFGKCRTAAGRVLVGTQTLEQSLDIDADLLLTDLAPIDVLLQRIGRLHRHARADRGAFGEARAVVLVPAERDLTRFLGRVADRHGLGPRQDGRGTYPDLAQLEATLRVLEANPGVSIPADNRRLVERSLHPEVVDAIAADLGTAWANHAADRAGFAYAERGAARDLSLDLATPFRDLVFPDAAEAVATRLGARDLLLDLPDAPTGPFGEPIERLAIPHWMAGGISADDPPILTPTAGGFEVQLGARRYRYDRWGLALST